MVEFPCEIIWDWSFFLGKLYNNFLFPLWKLVSLNFLTLMGLIFLIWISIRNYQFALFFKFICTVVCKVVSYSFKFFLVSMDISPLCYSFKVYFKRNLMWWVKEWKEAFFFLLIHFYMPLLFQVKYSCSTYIIFLKAIWTIE